MPLPQWEDRRMLFSKGREVHEPSIPSARRASESSITETLTKAVSNTSTKAAEPASPTAAKMPFEKRASVSSGSPASPTAATSTAANRRRSSAASGSGGMFANLTGMKRGSQDYHDRRSSIEEMHGKSGMFSGVWSSAVRGVQKKPETINEPKRGVME